MLLQPRMHWTLPLGLAALLAACGGAGGDVSKAGVSLRCDTINAGDALTESSVDPGCVVCAVDNAGNASDDDPHSYARMSSGVALPKQSTYLRSTAQAGVIYPAGSQAGAFVSRLGGCSGAMVDGCYAVQLTTWLAGEQQELALATDAGFFTVTGRDMQYRELPTSSDDTLPHEFYSFKTTLPFDAVEISYGASGVYTTTPELRVYGLCSDASANDY